MARVPEYTQEIFLDRSQPGNVTATGQIGFNKAQASLQDAQRYEERGAKAAKFGNEIQAQRDVQGQLRARERFNQFQRTKIENQQDFQNKRMTSPDGFAKEFDDWHRINGGEIEDEINGAEDNQPFDNTLFRQLMDADRTQTLAQNTDWENGMRVRNITTGTEQNLDAMNVNFALTKPGLKDLKKQIDAQREYVTRTGAQVLDPAQQQRLFGYGNDKAARAVFDNMKETDPRKLRNVLMYGQANQDQLIDFVFDVEGQDQIAQEPDGAIAKYGINSKHNNMTNEQVKNLTADDARAILKSKYWDPRLDKMPPAFRAVAFDALVNHGNDKDTWAMIQASKGDPYTLISMRQQYYASLIAKDPGKYAKYKAGWDQRMQEMAGYAQAQEDGGQEFLQYASIINPDIITQTQAELPAAIAAKDRQDEAIKKQKITEFNTAYTGAKDILTNDLEPLGQEELDQVQQLAINSGDADSIAKADALVNMRTYVNNLKGLGEPQLKQVIRQASATVNKQATPENRLALELAETVLKNQQAAVKTEGIGYWGRIGQIKMPQPIDYANPLAAKNELRSREDSTLNVYQKTGKLMPVLTPDEIDGLKTQLETLPANEVSGLLGYFDNLDQVSKSNLAQAVDEKSPILATAISVDNLDARRRILIGSKMEPKYKKEEMQTNIAEILDPMIVDPQFKASASQSLMAWYNAKSQEERDFSEDISIDRIKQGITEIYGPMVDLSFSGTDTVFSFKDETGYFVPDDDIYNMFHGINDDQLTKMFGELPKGAMGETVTAKDIRNNGRIVSAGDGLYNVVFDGIGGLYNNKGDLVEIDGRKLLSEYKNSKKKSKADYGLGNIDLNARPVVENQDGTISTVRSMSFEEDGKEVLVPTVSEDGRILSDEEAIQQYKQTGKYLGKFDSVDAANTYAEKLHKKQEKQYKK